MSEIDLIGFPSPTGVNYYECNEDCPFLKYLQEKCFRPQQGLTIMNLHMKILEVLELITCFRPQQGLTIMNYTYI